MSGGGKSWLIRELLYEAGDNKNHRAVLMRKAAGKLQAQTIGLRKVRKELSELRAFSKELVQWLDNGGNIRDASDWRDVARFGLLPPDAGIGGNDTSD